MNKKTLNNKDEEQLFYAIEANDVVALQKLVKRNLDVNHIFYGGHMLRSYWTCLHICCERGRYDACQVLLQAGADPNIQDRNGQTPLMYAASTGWLDIMQLLLNNGTDTNIKDATSATVAHVAASCDDSRVIKCLIESGTDINGQDNVGRTPLWFTASRNVDVTTLKNIVHNIGNDVINACDYRRGRNALQAAIMLTHQDLFKKVEVLVDNGIDINNTDLRHQTSLMNIIQRWYELKAKNEFTAVFKDDLLSSFYKLLDCGYDINYHTAGTRNFDHDGSALHLAAKLGLSDITQIIIDNGGKVDQTNTKGLTPLHVAARYWQIDVAKTLIENGCNKSAVSLFTFGKKSMFGTAFRMALETGGIKMALFLVDAGYDLHVESFLFDESDIPEVLNNKQKVFQYFKQVKMARENRQPFDLFWMCLKYLRFQFASQINIKVECLPLPKYLRDIISFKLLLC